MRRTVFLALLAALLCAPAAHAAGPIQIIRDCADDGVLQGQYSASDLRRARAQIPTDVDEYSDCRDVLSRAIAAATRPPSSPSSGAPGTSAPTDSGSQFSDNVAEGPKVVTPTTSQDATAITRATDHGGDPVVVMGRTVRPVASIGRNDIPHLWLIVLVLLLAAAIVAAAPTVRRRVVADRAP